METVLLDQLNQLLRQGNSAALVLVTKVQGSAPAFPGAMMIVPAKGTPIGTVGGGGFEAKVIGLALDCLQESVSKSYTIALEEVPMICGGQAEVFIRVFGAKAKLLIVGDGHIARELYQLGLYLDFEVVIFGDRPDYTNRERFPLAADLRLGDIEDQLKDYSIGHDCYLVIATRGHQGDELALKTVINTNAAYIGMVGSRSKTQQILANLAKLGVSQAKLDEVYSPVGLALGGRTPAEIAFSIMAEVILVKNQGQSSHLKDLMPNAGT